MKTQEILARDFLKHHAGEASRTLENLTPEAVSALLEKAALGATVAVMNVIDSRTGAECLSRWSPERRSGVLTALPRGRAARLLRLVEDPERERIVDSLPEDTARVLHVLLRYPEGTAAAVMDSRIVAYPQDLRVGESWKRLKRDARDLGFLVYVVDGKGILRGELGLRELMSAHPRDTLGSVMHGPPAWIDAQTGIAAMLDHHGWRARPELPVADGSGFLLGLIRYARFRQLELETMGEDQTRPWQVALGLGELFWAGSSRLLQELTAALEPAPSRRHTLEKHDGEQSHSS